MIAFLFTPLGRYVALGAGLVALFAAAWGFVALREHAAYKAGVADQASAVKAQDAKAVAAADKAKVSVDACYEAGRDWDQSKGACRD